MHTTHPNLFVTYCETFDMNTGNKNSSVVDEVPSITRSSTSSPLVFDSEKDNYHFPLLNDSNSFGTVDSDGHISIKIHIRSTMKLYLRPSKN